MNKSHFREVLSKYPIQYAKEQVWTRIRYRCIDYLRQSRGLTFLAGPILLTLGWLEGFMAKSLKLILFLCLLCSLNVVPAQQFPLWERLLRHYGGKTDETPVIVSEFRTHEAGTADWLF